MGSLSGSICGGWQSEKIGRKKSMIVDCFLFITGTLISAVAPNFYLLLFSRWLLGHCSASSMVSAPIYTSETSQPQMRKTTGFFPIVCYTIGFALSLVFGKYLIFLGPNNYFHNN